MTEGIIQKVFEKYRPKRKPNGNYPYFTPRMFEELQQELIAEIKKKAHWNYPNYSNGQHDILSLTGWELIGDMN